MTTAVPAKQVHVWTIALGGVVLTACAWTFAAYVSEPIRQLSYIAIGVAVAAIVVGLAANLARSVVTRGRMPSDPPRNLVISLMLSKLVALAGVMFSISVAVLSLATNYSGLAFRAVLVMLVAGAIVMVTTTAGLAVARLMAALNQPPEA